MVVETPGDRPMPFIVTAVNGTLVLSSGRHGRESHQHRASPGREGPGERSRRRRIDLEDLPDASNVVIATVGDPPYKVFEEAGGVTLLFQGAAAEKGLLRRIDARKFDIPVKAIAPSGGKKGLRSPSRSRRVPRTPWKRGTARSWWRSRKVRPEGRPTSSRARLRGTPSDGEGDVEPESMEAKAEPATPEGSQSWGSSPGAPTSAGNTKGSGSPWTSRMRSHQRIPDHRRGQQPEHHHVG